MGPQVSCSKGCKLINLMCAFKITEHGIKHGVDKFVTHFYKMSKDNTTLFNWQNPNYIKVYFSTAVYTMCLSNTRLVS